MRLHARLTALLLVVCASLSVTSAQQPPGPGPKEQKDWIARSNEYAQQLVALQAKYSPEMAGRMGVPGLDEQVMQLPADRREKQRADAEAMAAQIDKWQAAEKDPLVRQDLQIMAKAVKNSIRGNDLNAKYNLPYFNASAIVFGGIQSLLDDQVAEGRRKAALVRLRKYAGLEPGIEPLVDQLKARTTDWAKPGQIGPAKIEVETDLARAGFLINGIGQLFEKYKIEGYQEPYAKLKQQLTDYNAWVKQDILPRARSDFRLPPEVYAFSLEQFGVDIPPAQLTAMAHKAFAEYQTEMQQLAATIAKERGWTATDYRDVIKELKKDQLVGDKILPQYQDTLKKIEDIIRRRTWCRRRCSTTKASRASSCCR
jgi:uncharacterized protein (DUF885 family)